MIILRPAQTVLRLPPVAADVLSPARRRLHVHRNFLFRPHAKSVGAAGLLQPAFGAGDAGGLYAIAGPQFADGFGEIVAHRAVGEIELGSDVAAGQTFAGN
jgi:hypothetical protein